MLDFVAENAGAGRTAHARDDLHIEKFALADVSAGFDVWQGKRFSLRLDYEGRFGADTSDNGDELELHKAF
jgi:uncharacterized protein with beta-barrel porin domain